MSAQASQTTDRFFAEHYSLGTTELGRLLDLALERGGDYADVFVEYSLHRNINFEEESIKSASASTGQGVGVRVVSGDAIGYAYSEDFAWPNLQRAAQTAGNIAQAGGQHAPIAVATVPLPDYYAVENPAVNEPAEAKLDLIRRADSTARAYAPTITHVMVMFAEEERRTMVATSEGVLARGRAAAGDARPASRVRAQRRPAKRFSRERRSRRAGVLHRRILPRGHGPRGRADGDHTARRRRCAGRRDAGRAGTRLVRRPVARSRGPRLRSRLQPQAHQSLYRSRWRASGRPRRDPD